MEYTNLCLALHSFKTDIKFQEIHVLRDDIIFDFQHFLLSVAGMVKTRRPKGDGMWKTTNEYITLVIKSLGK
jgi:hypothetical protein